MPWMQPLAQGARRQWRAHAVLPTSPFPQEQTTLPFEFFLHRCLKKKEAGDRNRGHLEQDYMWKLDLHEVTMD